MMGGIKLSFFVMMTAKNKMTAVKSSGGTSDSPNFLTTR
jgi:hypothetical protein